MLFLSTDTYCCLLFRCNPLVLHPYLVQLRFKYVEIELISRLYTSINSSSKFADLWYILDEFVDFSIEKAYEVEFTKSLSFLSNRFLLSFYT